MNVTINGYNITCTPEEFRALVKTPAAEPAPTITAPPPVTATQTPPAPFQPNLFRAKEQPKLLPQFHGMRIGQFVSGVFVAFQNLRDRAIAMGKEELSAWSVADEKLVARSDSTERDRIRTLIKAGLIKAVTRHGRRYYLVNLLDDSEAVAILKSAKVRNPDEPPSRKTYETISFDRAAKFVD